MKNNIIFATITVIILISCFSCNNVESNKKGPFSNQKSNEIEYKRSKSSKTINLDSIERVNTQNIVDFGNEINKLYISRKDSSIYMNPENLKIHRIIGYKEPKLQSERLVLISVYTDDVKNNPFNYKLGAYYSTNDINFVIKYKGDVNNFIKTEILKDNVKTIIFFEKKWTEFDNLY